MTVPIDRTRRVATFFLFALLLCACASGPKVTVDTRRALQTRIYNHITPKALFNRVRRLLSSRGVQITRAEPKEGVLAGSIASGDTRSFSRLFGEGSLELFRSEERYDISVNLWQVDEQNIVLRIVFVRFPLYTLQGERREEIANPKFYERFFSELATELQGPAEKKSKRRRRSAPGAQTPRTAS